MKSKTKVRWSRHPDKVFIFEISNTLDGEIYETIREYDPEAEKTKQAQLAYAVNGISSKFSLTKDELTPLENNNAKKLKG